MFVRSSRGLVGSVRLVAGSIALVVGMDACGAGSSPAPSAGPQPDARSVARALHPRASASPSAKHRRLGRGWLAAGAAAGQDLLYVTSGDGVVVFSNPPHHPKEVGELTSGIDSPYGLFVDTNLNLYVCNQSGSVVVFPPGQTSPSFTYSSGLSRPLYAVADASHLFVGNAGTGAIVEYALGNGQPVATLQTFGVEVDGMALDSASDLYAAYRTGDGPTDGGIEYFPSDGGAGKDLGITLDAPQGLTVSVDGSILVVETQGVDRVDAFHFGQTEAYAHSKKIRSTPTQIQLDGVGQYLYISDLESTVKRIPYPLLQPMSGYLGKSQVGGTQGIALSPPAPAPSPIASPR
jgi:hypothetical protein